MTRVGVLMLAFIVGFPGMAQAALHRVQKSDNPIIGEVGVYAVRDADEIRAMAAAGLHLAVTGYAEPGSDRATAMREALVRYIDVMPQQIIYRACRNALKETGSCPQDKQDAALADVRAHIEQTAADDLIAGYWVLDDYPGGDVRHLLTDVHAAIDAARRTSGLAHPAVCGFGGQLDSVGPSSLLRQMTDDQRFAKVVSNYDAGACDMVAVYLYGVRKDKDSSQIDWEMRWSLRDMFAALRNRGWDQARVPLIGIPHAFAYLDSIKKTPYVLPSAAEVAIQSEAFCRAGAVALLAFTWDDGYVGKSVELSGSDTLREGLRQGAARCRKIWSNGR